MASIVLSFPSYDHAFSVVTFGKNVDVGCFLSLIPLRMELSDKNIYSFHNMQLTIFFDVTLLMNAAVVGSFNKT